jgi:hypothetical protein
MAKGIQVNLLYYRLYCYRYQKRQLLPLKYPIFTQIYVSINLEELPLYKEKELLSTQPYLVSDMIY